ncbi:C4-dicarboxylate TRAP transporter large permease protein DctM [subsurface metagenome]
MVTIGNVAIPMQRSRGYQTRYICGTIAAGGTLGILIPPSINMILYGSITETSVAKLFMAGFIPGGILSLLFISFIVLYSLLKQDMAPPTTESYTWRARIYGLKSLIPVLVLVGVIMGGIYTGFATPTEAAGIGVLGAFFIAVIYRRLSWTFLKASCVATVEATCWCLFLMVGANILGFGLSRAQIPQHWDGNIANSNHCSKARARNSGKNATGGNVGNQ